MVDPVNCSIYKKKKEKRKKVLAGVLHVLHKKCVSLSGASEKKGNKEQKRYLFNPFSYFLH